MELMNHDRLPFDPLRTLSQPSTISHEKKTSIQSFFDNIARFLGFFVPFER